MNDDSSEEEISTEEENRVQERLRCEEIIGAMGIIPNDMDFNDGCVLLALLNTIRHQIWRHRLADSLSEFWNGYVFSIETDSNGRITELSLGDINDDDDEIELPPIIERLQKLREIKLKYCRGIPKELGNLPLLKNIAFVSLVHRNSTRAYQRDYNLLVLLRVLN